LSFTFGPVRHIDVIASHVLLFETDKVSTAAHPEIGRLVSL